MLNNVKTECLRENENDMMVMENIMKSKCSNSIIDKIIFKVWKVIFKTSLAFTTAKN